MRPPTLPRLVVLLFLGSALAGGADFGGWCPVAQRAEIRPDFTYEPAAGPGRSPAWVVGANKPGTAGYWSRIYPVRGGAWYSFTCVRRIAGLDSPRRESFVRIDWLDSGGSPAQSRTEEVIVPPYDEPGEAPPDYATEERPSSANPGWQAVTGTWRAPANAAF